MPRKIAPKLSALVRNDIAGNGTRYNLFDATLGKQAGDEVRALLAVARESHKFFRATAAPSQYGKVLAALRRLERAGGGAK